LVAETNGEAVPTGVNDRSQAVAELLGWGVECKSQGGCHRREFLPFEPDPRCVWHPQCLNFVLTTAARACGFQIKRDGLAALDEFAPDRVQWNGGLAIEFVTGREKIGFAFGLSGNPAARAGEVLLEMGSGASTESNLKDSTSRCWDLSPAGNDCRSMCDN
jgi:hypothetical protein